MSKVSRRAYLESLLQIGGKVAASASLSPWLFAAVAEAQKERATGLVIQGGFLERPAFYQTDIHIPSRHYSNRRAFRLDLESGKLLEIPSSVAIHSIENHPTKPNLAVAFSRHSDTIGLIDWNKKIERSIIQIPDAMSFYGHGAFTNDGKFIFASVQIGPKPYRLTKYAIAKIEMDSFKIVEMIDFPFSQNHDIVWLEGDKFAITGGQTGSTPSGAKPQLVLFDGQNHSFTVVEGPATTAASSGSIGLRHLLKVDSKKVVASVTRAISSEQLDGEIIEFDLRNSTTKSLSKPSPKIQTELLSFDIASDGRVWVSIPERKQLTILDSKTREIVHTINFNVPVRSVRYVESHRYFVIGTDKGISAYDQSSMTRVSDFDNLWSTRPISGLVCSHTRLIKV